MQECEGMRLLRQWRFVKFGRSGSQRRGKSAFIASRESGKQLGKR